MTIRSRSRTLAFVTIMLALAGLPATRAVGTEPLDDPFDGPLDQATWTIERGNAWTEDGWLVCQSDGTWPRSTVVTAGEGGDWSDYTFRTRFYAEGGGNDWYMAFVFFRVEDYHGLDEGRFYYTWISTPLWGGGGDWDIGLDRHTESGVETLAVVSNPACLNGQDNLIEVTVSGGHIVMRVNDQIAVDVVDPNPVLTGGVGLGSVWEARTRFDYAQVMYPVATSEGSWGAVKALYR
ncbi:MAG: family 16 glycoside hydrolase [Candidatus Krumholzibacteriia bacterium]